MKTMNMHESESRATGNAILEQLSFIASGHNGRCHSTDFKNNKQKILWECSKGHQWYASSFSIKIRKSWCPVCAGNQPLGMIAMHKLADTNKGKCLSTQYQNCKTKMLWQCREGHQFQSTPDYINQGNWCPICRIPRI